MKINDKNESSETLRTTPSMRKKAKLVSRFCINILKCWKMCKKHKKTQNSTVSV